MTHFITEKCTRSLPQCHILSLRGAFPFRRCEEHSDEAISVDVTKKGIATHRQVGARNDKEDPYPMLQTHYYYGVASLS